MKINKLLVPAFALVIPLSVSVTSVAAILVLLSSAINLYRTRLLQVIKHPVSIATFIFLALYLLGTFYSVGLSTDLNLALRKSSRLLFIILLWPVFMDQKIRQHTILAFLAAVFISVVAAIWNSSPIFVDPISTSLFVSFSIFLLAHYAVVSMRYRWPAIALASFFSYYLFFHNGGRVGYILFFVLYALFVWQIFRRNFKAQIYAAVLLSIVVAAVMYLPTTFATRNKIAQEEIQSYVHSAPNETFSHHSSTGLRMMLWRNSLQIAQHKPVFGWGSGSFTQAYLQVAPKENVDLQIDKRSNPHSQYMLVLVELGVVGLAALLYLFFCLTRAFWGINQLEGYLGFGLITAFAIGCLANSWLLDFTPMHFFVLFTAFCLGGSLNLKRNL